MFVIVGLGNPGTDYQNNRHNIGFMVVDSICRCGQFSPWRTKFQALVAEGNINGEKLLLVKPQIFMNNSGQSLAAVLKFYKLPLQNIIVFHDDLDLAPAKLRIKTGGSSGGHNGIKSIDAHCGKDYQRVRLGIGHPGHEKGLVHNYVMGNFSKAERQWLEPLTESIGHNIGLLIQGDTNGFMNKVFTQTHNASSNGEDSTVNTEPASSEKNKFTLAARPQKTKQQANAMAEMLKKLFGNEENS